MIKLIFSLAFLFSPLFLVAQLRNIGLSVVEMKDSTNSVVGKTFPQFSAATLDGKEVSERVLQGKITLINLWFKDCSPCRAEFGALNRLYYKYKDNPNVEILSFTKRSGAICKRCG
ncbi:MAG: TlpA family protein disulfide reductase [Prevotellaceae bacterium]|nr:TlpA family protein disulfide reductase [Prevotellaceae bacterium]